MDITTSAQVLSQAIQTAQNALTVLSATAQAAGQIPTPSTGFSPTTLIAMAAPVIAHSAPAILSKLDQYPMLKVAAQDAGAVAVATGASMLSGNTWQVALGHGLCTAGSARLYTFITGHPNSPLSIIAKAFLPKQGV